MPRYVVLDEDAIEHLRKLVDYNWADERRDYETHDGEKDCHIFVSLVALDNLLTGRVGSANDYIEPEPCGHERNEQCGCRE